MVTRAKIKFKDTKLEIVADVIGHDTHSPQTLIIRDSEGRTFHVNRDQVEITYYQTIHESVSVQETGPSGQVSEEEGIFKEGSTEK